MLSTESLNQTIKLFFIFTHVKTNLHQVPFIFGHTVILVLNSNKVLLISFEILELGVFLKKDTNSRNLIEGVQSSSWPAECPTSDLVKLLIEGVKELLQFSHH